MTSVPMLGALKFVKWVCEKNFARCRSLRGPCCPLLPLGPPAGGWRVKNAC